MRTEIIYEVPAFIQVRKIKYLQCLKDSLYNSVGKVKAVFSNTVIVIISNTFLL